MQIVENSPPLWQRLWRILACWIVLNQPLAAQAGEANPNSAARAHYTAAQAAAKAWIAREATRQDLQMIPMRDDVRLAAALMFPKDREKSRLPTILIFSPYNSDMMVDAFSVYFERFLRNGYTIALVNSRGRYFSEGTYRFLGGSGTDAFDTIDWLAKQPWSSGKIGSFGCSGSAEEQHRMNAMGHPALAAAVTMGSGAGIGRVGSYAEMGNFYRGGILQNFWFGWYYRYGWKYRPSLPSGAPSGELARMARFWPVEPKLPPIILDDAVRTLPVDTIMRSIHALPSDMDDFVQRLPNDRRWRNVEFGNEGDRAHSPTMYINSWYDISVGPNLAMYSYQRDHAATTNARDNMFMVIAPTLHCEQGSIEGEHTIVGERDMGDARLDYVGLVQRWFDHWLKGIDTGLAYEPRVRAFAMGANHWRRYASWPPAGARPVAFYLDSGGAANGHNGNGRLLRYAPHDTRSDRYVYDPENPTPTVGGQFCCFDRLQPGPWNQAEVTKRKDVLVFTSEPLAAPLEVAGSIPVTLYVSSDAKDTDLIVTLVDVFPDGRAFNLDTGALRLRWREGYTRPVLMRPGTIYKAELAPLVTSNVFLTGHRIRVMISSSSFPQFERNLNTGGNNYDETRPVTANNVIHHGKRFPSRIVLPVIAATGVDGRRRATGTQ